MQRYLPWVVVVVVALSALALVTYGHQSPDQKLIAQDQDTIDGCRREAKGTSLTLAQQQRTIEACQKLEGVYRYNWGADPLPQTAGVQLAAYSLTESGTSRRSHGSGKLFLEVQCQTSSGGGLCCGHI